MKRSLVNYKIDNVDEPTRELWLEKQFHWSDRPC